MKRLGDLADAAGMSISGVRITYSHTVASTTGTKPPELRAADPA